MMLKNIKKCLLTTLLGLCVAQTAFPVATPVSTQSAQPFLVEAVKNSLGTVVAKIFYVQSATLPQADLNPLPLKADQAALFIKQFGVKTGSLDASSLPGVEGFTKAIAAGKNTSIRFEFTETNNSFVLNLVFKRTLTSSTDGGSVEVEATVYGKAQTIPVHARAFAKAAVANDAWWMKHGLKLAGALAAGMIIGTGIVYRDALAAEYKKRFSSVPAVNPYDFSKDDVTALYEAYFPEIQEAREHKAQDVKTSRGFSLGFVPAPRLISFEKKVADVGASSQASQVQSSQAPQEEQDPYQNLSLALQDVLVSGIFMDAVTSDVDFDQLINAFRAAGVSAGQHQRRVLLVKKSTLLKDLAREVGSDYSRLRIDLFRRERVLFMILDDARDSQLAANVQALFESQKVFFELFFPSKIDVFIDRSEFSYSVSPSPAATQYFLMFDPAQTDCENFVYASSVQPLHTRSIKRDGGDDFKAHSLMRGVTKRTWKLSDVEDDESVADGDDTRTIVQPKLFIRAASNICGGCFYHNLKQDVFEPQFLSVDDDGADEASCGEDESHSVVGSRRVQVSQRMRGFLFSRLSTYLYSIDRSCVDVTVQESHRQSYIASKDTTIVQLNYHAEGKIQEAIEDYLGLDDQVKIVIIPDSLIIEKAAKLTELLTQLNRFAQSKDIQILIVNSANDASLENFENVDLEVIASTPAERSRFAYISFDTHAEGYQRIDALRCACEVPGSEDYPVHVGYSNGTKFNSDPALMYFSDGLKAFLKAYFEKLSSAV